jgi:hypothetical protein
MPGRRALLASLVLGACASRPPAPPAPLAGVPQLSCVPFARALSGIELRGDAWRWWDAAAGTYPRGAAPAPGAVLVLDRTSRMRQGHVSVVLRQVGQREIRVAHANWGSGAEKGRVEPDVPVIDISPRNDWSLVRVWHGPSGGLGTTAYAARGFVLPASRPDPVRLAADVAPAARRAAGSQGS